MLLPDERKGETTNEPRVLHQHVRVQRAPAISASIRLM